MVCLTINPKSARSELDENGLWRLGIEVFRLDEVLQKL